MDKLKNQSYRIIVGILLIPVFILTILVEVEKMFFGKYIIPERMDTVDKFGIELREKVNFGEVNYSDILKYELSALFSFFPEIVIIAVVLILINHW